MSLLIYIYSGPLKRHTAGSAAILNLGRNLESRGHDVWFINYNLFGNPSKKQKRFSIYRALKNNHINQNPIVIYPESVPYNLLGAALPVWYLLSQPNEVYNSKKDKERLSTRETFSFSKNIKQSWNSKGPVLHTPTINLIELEGLKQEKKEFKDVVYSGKFTDVYKQSIPIELASATKLHRNPKDLSRSDFLSILSRTEYLHCFENTAVALEALFLEVKVCFHFNEFFVTPILDCEVGGIDLGKCNFGADTGFIRNPQFAKSTYLEYLDNEFEFHEMELWLNSHKNSLNKSRDFFVSYFIRNLLISRFISHKVVMLLRFIKSTSKKGI